MSTFTVRTRYWHNNWSEPFEDFPFEDFEVAKEFADASNTFEVDEIGDNCYVNNGTQTWVEDFTGNKIYEPLV